VQSLVDLDGGDLQPEIRGLAAYPVHDGSGQNARAGTRVKYAQDPLTR